MSPWTSARCTSLSMSPQYATTWNSPCAVGRRVSAMRRTNVSLARRYSIRLWTVIIFSPCLAQNSTRSGTRAMVPSSFMTSQITPAGYRPAIRARSTAASVWPARRSTPPSRARSGNVWPGRSRSSGCVAGSTSAWTVAARSKAEMPVVVRPLASTETVKAVPRTAVLLLTIWRSCSSSQRSSVSGTQMRPRPCVAIKAMSAGVTFSAAMVRSPSFSRSSSSQTTTILPARMSSRASSMVANGSGIGPRLDEPFDVLGDHVDLDVDPVAHPLEAEGGQVRRVGNQGDAEAAGVAVHHGQAHAVERHEALGHDVAHDLRPGFEAHGALDALRLDLHDRGRAVDVALDQVAAHASLQRHRALQAYPVAGLERAQVGARQRLRREVHLQARLVHGHCREAHAVRRHALVHTQALAHHRGIQCKPPAARVHVDGGDGAQLLHDAREHALTPSAPDGPGTASPRR